MPIAGGRGRCRAIVGGNGQGSAPGDGFTDASARLGLLRLAR